MNLALFLSSFLAIIIQNCSAFYYQFPEQWMAWKSEHGKNYSSEREDLERHLVWLSNKKYIDSHNANEEYFGYGLAMNSFGDLV